MRNLLSLITVITLFACSQNAKQGSELVTMQDTLEVKSDALLTKEQEKRKREEQNKRNSLRLEFALNDAFKVAEKNFSAENFNKEYELQPDDSSYTINVEIIIADIFASNQKYFLLRRHVPWATFLDLYKIADRRVERIISREQGGMTYVRDTIFDVNGDGFKDFLVHWYPSSGCCRRDVYNVYLNLPDERKFSKDYEFINPTFSAKERIIRGVEYGHPGEVGLYKFKWNGLEVDTLEFIYPDVNNKGQFIKTKKEAYRPMNKEGIILKAVPKEYSSIESYEWFADF